MSHGRRRESRPEPRDCRALDQLSLSTHASAMPGRTAATGESPLGMRRVRINDSGGGGLREPAPTLLPRPVPEKRTAQGRRGPEGLDLRRNIVNPENGRAGEVMGNRKGDRRGKAVLGS